MFVVGVFMAYVASYFFSIALTAKVLMRVLRSWGKDSRDLAQNESTMYAFVHIINLLIWTQMVVYTGIALWLLGRSSYGIIEMPGVIWIMLVICGMILAGIFLKIAHELWPQFAAVRDQ